MVYYIGMTTMVSMSKPSFLLRAEQQPPFAPPNHQNLTSSSSSSSSRRRDLVFIVNPRVVAVGGDGTLHEVVNGFFWGGKPVSKHDSKVPHTTSLGLIPLGTGSDFARTFGWSNDPVDAIERLVKGSRSLIDVGVITKDGGDLHYFINVADIHLSAKAGYHASKYKRFGSLCYVIGALQAFFGHDNHDLKIRVNDGEWELYPKVTALCIGNAQFFGGGMRITPNAHPSSGNFEGILNRSRGGCGQQQHFCSIRWRASGIPSKEILNSAICYQHDMLKQMFSILFSVLEHRVIQTSFLVRRRTLFIS
ncbi:hypothetical protein M8C21_029743 [Ambrosia artemisiifolia]|uniref:DAGKc domain-containing protein n=1 Tax=Ambrosia artemisiifolia TaxID=4212 RepID=A0AAD5GCG8_AMBAR|nr:hypothetical protein M8C21_029743 [Ambrosia artemisiifolia]